MLNAVVFGSRGLAPTFAGMDRSYWQWKLQGNRDGQVHCGVFNLALVSERGEL